jgi:DNA processing protein
VSPSSSSAQYWLAFSLIGEIGAKRLRQIANAFHGDLQAAWHADERALEQHDLPAPLISAIVRARTKINPQAEFARVNKVGASLITMDDNRYPTLLRTISDPPPILYMQGEITPDDSQSIAIVGTRKCTTYGRDITSTFTKSLVTHGFTIVSGLAHGIDAIAHRAALEHGGRTIAVLGCGIDSIYPNDHRGLAHEIAKHGAVVSEFPIGTRPDAHNFPRRNRIISGLSLGVFIPEAPEKSGALITTSIAADQGREIFAAPGNIFSPASAGTNRLIQDGAKLVMSIDDILNELNIAHETVRTREVAEQIAPSNTLEASILKLLSAEPLHIDELARQLELPIAELISSLTMLELKGLARNVGHMQYSLTIDR